MANRRAYRPDRHIYRDLRRRSANRFTWITALEILIILLVLAAVVWVVRWAFFSPAA
jgi:hypothetical protein